MHNEPATYALEGSVAIAGAGINWLNNLGVISSADEISIPFFPSLSKTLLDTLATQVDDSAGVIIVPAFTGLLAPYWRPEARGMMIGLSLYTQKTHIARYGRNVCSFITMPVLCSKRSPSSRAR